MDRSVKIKRILTPSNSANQIPNLPTPTGTTCHPLLPRRNISSTSTDADAEGATDDEYYSNILLAHTPLPPIKSVLFHDHLLTPPPTTTVRFFSTKYTRRMNTPATKSIDSTFITPLLSSSHYLESFERT